MQEYNRAVDALSDPATRAAFEKEQSDFMAEIERANGQDRKAANTATLINSNSRNARKRARRAARGIK